MSFTPENSAIALDKSTEERIAAATSGEQIKEILREAAIKQNLVVPDIYDPNVLLPVEPGSAPRSFAKTVTVNGQKTVLEATTELDLAQRETEFYRQLFAQPAAGAEQPRDSQGRFTADHSRNANQHRTLPDTVRSDDPAAEAARQADLRTKMLSGAITVDQYMVQSGAVERALSEAGISPAALREVSDQRYQQSWQASVDEFLKSSDWPGGQENLKLLGEKLIEMNATDTPSVEVLQRAYVDLKRANRLTANPETVLERKLADCKTPAEIREALSGAGLYHGGLWDKR